MDTHREIKEQAPLDAAIKTLDEAVKTLDEMIQTMQKSQDLLRTWLEPGSKIGDLYERKQD